MAKLKQFFLNVKNPIDKPDLFIFSGLSCLGWGLWKYEPWISLSVCGFILILFGVIGSVFSGLNKGGQ